jgi:hypothetical protein
MSWSVSAIGKASAVAAKAAEQFAAIKCSEPEETIKNTAASAVALALSAFPAHYAVRLTASGSQHQPDQSKPDEKVNNLRVEIEPIWGFVE